MKNLFRVFCFESGNYFKSKSYMLSTILICVLAIVVISLPGLLKGSSDKGEGEKADNVIAETIAICDPSNIVSDELISSYGKAEIKRLPSADEVKAAVESEETAAGFVIHSTHEYDYYVYNKSIMEDTQEIFSELMSTAAKMKYCMPRKDSRKRFYKQLLVQLRPCYLSIYGYRYVRHDDCYQCCQ